MTADDAIRQALEFGACDVIAIFRCSCGRLAAMAERSNDRCAVMIHGSPHCEMYEGCRTLREAELYFLSLDPLPLTFALKLELQRSQADA